MSKTKKLESLANLSYTVSHTGNPGVTLYHTGEDLHGNPTRSNRLFWTQELGEAKIYTSIDAARRVAKEANEAFRISCCRPELVHRKKVMIARLKSTKEEVNE